MVLHFELNQETLSQVPESLILLGGEVLGALELMVTILEVYLPEMPEFTSNESRWDFQKDIGLVVEGLGWQSLTYRAS